MTVTPHSLERIRTEHTHVIQSAMKKLAGPLRDQAKAELNQTKTAPLYYVQQPLLDLALEAMKVEDEAPQKMPSNTGILVFEDGTGSCNHACQVHLLERPQKLKLGACNGS